MKRDIDDVMRQVNSPSCRLRFGRRIAGVTLHRGGSAVQGGVVCEGSLSSLRRWTPHSEANACWQTIGLHVRNDPHGRNPQESERDENEHGVLKE